MNKYSKAVKTAATVGMSLAMVLSAVTPVSAAFNPANNVCNDIADPAIVNLTEKFGLVKTSEKTLTEVLESTVLKEKKANGLYSVDDTVYAEDQVVTLWSYLGSDDVWEILHNITSRYGVDGCAFTASEKEVAQYLLDARVALEELETLIDDAEAITDETFDIDAAEAALKALNDFAYLGNATRDEQREVKAQIKRVTKLIEEYTGTSYADAELKTWLETQTEYLENLLDDNREEDLANSETLDELKDYIAGVKATAVYKRYKSNDAVVDVMSQFEEIIEAVEEVETILDQDENAAYEAFTAKRGAYNGKRVSELFGDLTDVNNSDDFAGITLEDYKVFAEFKKEVIDQFVTFNYKKVGKTTFVSMKYDGDFGTFISDDEMDDLLAYFERDFFITTDKDGNTKYDRMVEYFETLEDSLNALAVVEKLDAVTLTVNDRDAIVAADDALYTLAHDYAETNTTKAEDRAIRDASRKVTELLEAYRIKFGSINAELNGWVNKGNGDYAYYENGNAVTKWVASGKDWYYVKDGKMLRNSWVAQDARGNVWYYVGNDGAMVTNTTIDGCYINSFGAWTK